MAPTSSTPAKVEITHDQLQRYCKNLETIAKLENTPGVKEIAGKIKEHQQIQELLKEFPAKIEESEKRVKKEKADVDNLNDASVKAYFDSQDQFKAAYTKEEKEHLEALNRHEMLLQREKQIIEQNATLEKEIDAVKTEVDTLKTAYAQSEEILESIFGGSYASEIEWALEAEVDMLKDLKNRIGIAKSKWNNATVLVDYAGKQLQTGISVWSGVKNIPPEQISEEGFKKATQARNQFVAALQNLQNAQKYLSGITFPFATPDDVAAFQTAIQHIYTDLQEKERWAIAENCYRQMHSATVKLEQWMFLVIDDTICSDYDKTSTELKQAEKKLSIERLKLMRAKVTQVSSDKGGQDWAALGREIDAAILSTESAQTLILDPTTGGDDAALAKARKGLDNNLSAKDNDEIKKAAAATNKQLFGGASIDSLKEKFYKQQATIQRKEDTTKDRATGDLQERLARRRAKRSENATPGGA